VVDLHALGTVLVPFAAVNRHSRVGAVHNGPEMEVGEVGGGELDLVIAGDRDPGAAADLRFLENL
jgi:hypothetical protein